MGRILKHPEKLANEFARIISAALGGGRFRSGHGKVDISAREYGRIEPAIGGLVLVTA
jgi:hypothetical protein